jgi:kynurenine formamidase
MVGNTGTYLDSPFHRFPDGDDLAALPLDRLVDLSAVLIRVNDGRRAIEPEVLNGREIAQRAVLFHTGWDRHWATEAYGSGHPFLSTTTVERLVAGGATVVGIDSLNIDDTADLSRPAHTGLLRAGIPIVEHLRGLEQLPEDGFRFTCVPARVKGFGTWPVRAFATLE